jgi:pimeloyl-ACP methyl ester carboxylesterase
MPEIQLSQGTLAYSDQGSGPAVVFIHGLLVDGRVWDGVVDTLSSGARCIVPDLPLGAHRRPMDATADLTPPGIAALIAELIERLELSDVTLVGNDTGGAFCQIVVANHPERIGRLVLTNCDAFENFPPPALRLVISALGRVPGALAALGHLGRLRSARRMALSLAPLTMDPIPDPLLGSWIAPLRTRAIRRDLGCVLRAIDSKHTLQAAERLRGFDRPALLVWGTRDKFFPVRDAERLAEVLPNARIERIEEARTFVQMDAPDQLASLIASFAAAETPAGAAA